METRWLIYRGGFLGVLQNNYLDKVDCYRLEYNDSLYIIKIENASALLSIMHQMRWAKMDKVIDLAEIKPHVISSRT